MLEHIKDLLKGSEYSEGTKDEAIRRILLYGEDSVTVMQQLGISDIYTVNNWINAYKKQVEKGLVTLPAMKKELQDDPVAIKKRNKELEKALKEANLMILALNTMIDHAEKNLNISIRKKRGTRQS
jgi:transposase